MPVLQREFDVPASQIGLFTAVYFLPTVLLAVPLGYLGDRFGRRPVFGSLALLYGLAGLAQAWATTYPLLLGLRALQGVGFAALMPLTITIIGDAYSGLGQLRAQGIRQVTMTASEAVAPLAGAALTAVGWHAALGAQGLYVVVGLAGFALLHDRVPHDAPGKYGSALRAALATPGLPGLLAAGSVRFIVKFALIAYLPVTLVSERGASVGEAAVVLSVASAVAALFGTQVTRFVHVAVPSRLMIAGAAVLGGSLVAFGWASTWQLALAVAVVFGAADGTFMVLQNGMVSQVAGPQVRAGVVAVSAMTRNVGKLVAPLAIGLLLLVGSPSVAFTVLGVLTWLLLPVVATIRRLDFVLVGRGSDLDLPVAAGPVVPNPANRPEHG